MKVQSSVDSRLHARGRFDIRVARGQCREMNVPTTYQACESRLGLDSHCDLPPLLECHDAEHVFSGDNVVASVVRSHVVH